jgi:hypothetical protein
MEEEAGLFCFFFHYFAFLCFFCYLPAGRQVPSIPFIPSNLLLVG